MAADESDDFGFFGFGEGGEDLVYGEAAEANDGPAKLLSGGIGDLLCGGPIDHRAGEVGCDYSPTHARQEAAASEFFFGEVRHRKLLRTEIVSSQRVYWKTERRWRREVTMAGSRTLGQVTTSGRWDCFDLSDMQFGAMI